MLIVNLGGESVSVIAQVVCCMVFGNSHAVEADPVGVAGPAGAGAAVALVEVVCDGGAGVVVYVADGEGAGDDLIGFALCEGARVDRGGEEGGEGEGGAGEQHGGWFRGQNGQAGR